VFIRQVAPKKINIDGKIAELYFRFPDEKEYKPLTETMAGTGFIIKHNGRDYLVTAKHIAKELLPSGEIVINLHSGQSTIVTFQSLLKANLLKGAHWFHHPKADVSIHPMGYPGNIDAMGIPENVFQKNDDDIKLLNRAYIVGFPMGLGVLDKLSPIAKEAKIASKLTSVTDPNIPPDLHFYLLDQALSQGYSGAPVFYMKDIMAQNIQIKVGEEAHLIGIQSIAISDQTGGKISLVVPITYLNDIFESPDFKAYEKGIAP
jgi:hypothetical protein